VVIVMELKEILRAFIRGVLVKSSASLELLSSCGTVALDKTGEFLQFSLQKSLGSEESQSPSILCEGIQKLTNQ
jgi:hypothetical protein